jgi:hypothetical protein
MALEAHGQEQWCCGRCQVRASRTLAGQEYYPGRRVSPSHPQACELELRFGVAEQSGRFLLLICCHGSWHRVRRRGGSQHRSASPLGGQRRHRVRRRGGRTYTAAATTRSAKTGTSCRSATSSPSPASPPQSRCRPHRRQCGC